MKRFVSMLCLSTLFISLSANAHAWERDHGQHRGHGHRWEGRHSGHHWNRDWNRDWNHRHHNRPRVSFNLFSYPYYPSSYHSNTVHTYGYHPQPQPQTIYYVQPQQPSVNISQNERYCREYQNHATVGGSRRSSYGQACMQPDGSWEIVN